MVLPNPPCRYVVVLVSLDYGTATAIRTLLEGVWCGVQNQVWNLHPKPLNPKPINPKLQNPKPINPKP